MGEWEVKHSLLLATWLAVRNCNKKSRLPANLRSLKPLKWKFITINFKIVPYPQIAWYSVSWMRRVSIFEKKLSDCFKIANMVVDSYILCILFSSNGKGSKLILEWSYLLHLDQ